MEIPKPGSNNKQFIVFTSHFYISFRNLNIYMSEHYLVQYKSWEHLEVGNISFFSGTVFKASLIKKVGTSLSWYKSWEHLAKLGTSLLTIYKATDLKSWEHLKRWGHLLD